MVFDSARAVLPRDSVVAAGLFARARDLDVVRFRAPGEFQSVVQRVARDTKSVYVPNVEGFAAEAAYRIPGNDLFLEHVHPNQHGYLLLAEMYFAALKHENFLGRKADMSRFAGWDVYQSRMALTDLDQRIAYHTIKTVTTRWPFVPVSEQLDYRGTYRPTDFVDSVAFAVSRGGMQWAQAKLVVGSRMVAAGETGKAVAEFQGLIRDEPRIEIGWELAGRAFLSAKDPARARPFLERAHAVKPTPFTSLSLAAIAMEEKKPERAIPLLEESLQFDPNNPNAMYQLSMAYALTRNVQGARGMAMRLAQVAPQYPGLREWLSALGIGAR
jgi:tetratricopeptide (TPR) repeat protein